MKANKVAKIIDHNHWVEIENILESKIFIISFRTPVLGPKDIGDYIHRLSVIWSYADEDSDAMPENSASKDMKVFEKRLVEAWEYDYNAILTAVLTFDGERQWIFYTKNVDECRKRLSEMPQNKEPYPIELKTDEDPECSYLRESFLSVTSWEEYQEGWEESLSSSENSK